MASFNERLENVGREMVSLVKEKNAAYGNSFAECERFLSILYPKGVEPAHYRDMLLLVRVFDKMMRIATRKNAFDESPWRDVLGYGLLASATDDRIREEYESGQDAGGPL